MEISRETFKSADNSAQNLILFDSIQGIGEKFDKFGSECENKHIKLDEKILKSGKINKGLTASSGILGGFLAFFTTKLFGG